MSHLSINYLITPPIILHLRSSTYVTITLLQWHSRHSATKWAIGTCSSVQFGPSQPHIFVRSPIIISVLKDRSVFWLVGIPPINQMLILRTPNTSYPQNQTSTNINLTFEIQMDMVQKWKKKKLNCIYAPLNFWSFTCHTLPLIFVCKTLNFTT